MKSIWFVTAVLCAANPALARETRQEILLAEKREKALRLSAYEVSKAEARFLGLERSRFYRNVLERGFHGVRPLVGGMPSGSGFVAGVGYLRDPDFGALKLEGNARYSTRGFSELDAELVLPSPRARRSLEAHLHTAVQDYTALRFFGLGNDTSAADLTYYGQRNRIFGGGVTAALSDSFRLMGDVDRLQVEVGAGDRNPSLETASFETDFNVYRFGAELTLLDEIIPAAGVSLSARFERYDDSGTGVFDFSRLVAEAKAYVPLGYRNRTLAVRLRTSQSDAAEGDRIPFYMMETLGGARTVRGYREYRFRDSRNLLLNVEYRWEVWTYADFTLFFDAGKVFGDASDTSFSGMHTGYGFGVRAHGPAGTILRVDLARSREGYRLHIGGGPSF